MVDRVQIKILDTSHGPVYEQIRLQISGMIDAGMLVSGFELPRPSKLAQDANVDKGEVSRAYFELEQQGRIVSRKSKNFLGETSVTYQVK